MHLELRRFIAEFVGTVTLTLIVVAVTSFLSLPMTLMRTPVAAAVAPAPDRHMT